MADFELDNGATETISIFSTATDPFLCQLHASLSVLGDFDVANNVTFYLYPSALDTYVLQYNAMLNIMTLTKQ